MSEKIYMNDENEDEVGVNEEEHVDCSEAFNTYHVIMWFIIIKLIKWMFIWKLKLCGLHCRCLLPEMMFCNGLDQLLMKLDLWRWLWGQTQTLVWEEELHLC